MANSTDNRKELSRDAPNDRLGQENEYKHGYDHDSRTTDPEGGSRLVRKGVDHG